MGKYDRLAKKKMCWTMNGKDIWLNEDIWFKST